MVFILRGFLAVWRSKGVLKDLIAVLVVLKANERYEWR